VQVVQSYYKFYNNYIIYVVQSYYKFYNNSVQPAQKLSFKTYTDCRKRMWDLNGLWNLNLPPPLKDPCAQATFVIGN
jgi:hypothetical protein